MILSHTALARHLIRLERKDANSTIVVREIATGDEHLISFAEEAYSLRLLEGYEFDTDVIRYRYSSMTTPSEVTDYNVRTGERTLRKRQDIPSGHDASAYVTRRLFASAPDGEQVPVSVLHRRDIALDGSAPCLLYGTAPTAMPSRPASRQIRCPWWTGVSSMRSRMCAAEPRRAGAGISTASARRSRTPSRIS